MPASKRAAKPSKANSKSDSKPVEAAAFAGIGPKAARLVAELAHRQDKAFYAERKPDFESLVYGPLKALFAEVQPRLARSYSKRTLSTKVFRIHRDVRFSNDKSPFKDHASGVIKVEGGNSITTSAGALYLQIGPDEGAAAGLWAMEPDQLVRYRKAVQHDKHGAALERLLKPLLKAGFTLIAAGKLSRAPKGVDPDHPRGDLLRLKGLALDFPPIPAKVRHSAGLARWCVDRAKECAPVVRWLLDHVG